MLGKFSSETGCCALCHEGLKDPKILQCFIDKNCAELWVRSAIQTNTLNDDGSLDCSRCRTPIAAASILSQEEIDILIQNYRSTGGLEVISDGTNGRIELLNHRNNRRIELHQLELPVRPSREVPWAEWMPIVATLVTAVASCLYTGYALGESRVTRISFAVGALATDALSCIGARVVSDFVASNHYDSLVRLGSFLGIAAALGSSMTACAGKSLLSGAGYGILRPVALIAASACGKVVGKAMDVASGYFKSAWNAFRR